MTSSTINVVLSDARELPAWSWATMVYLPNGTAEGKPGDRILLSLLIAEISVWMWHAVASISQVVNINGLLRTAKVDGKCYKQDHQVLSA